MGMVADSMYFIDKLEKLWYFGANRFYCDISCIATSLHAPGMA